MAATLHLHAAHQAAGARLVEVDGWNIPADFGDVRAEYDALRTGATRIDLSLRGRLRVTGRDRATFLHNMVSNDIVGLHPGQGCHAAKLTLQGKMEAAMHVLCLEDALLCDIDPGPAPRVRAALQRHLILEEARVEDIGPEWCLVAVQGPQASARLAACGLPVAELSEAEATTAALKHVSATIAGTTVRLLRNDHCGETGFDLWIPAAGASQVWEQLGEAGVRAIGLTALDLRRLEAGVPWAGSEYAGDTFPMEVGLDAGWISYTKGCYLGQETIARIHHLGHVNRSLRGLRFEASELPPRGSTVWAGDKRAGEVTSAAMSPRLGPVALALVHREHAAPGTSVVVEHSGGRIPAQVAALPMA
jgi:aminomethyltransferase